MRSDDISRLFESYLDYIPTELIEPSANQFDAQGYAMAIISPYLTRISLILRMKNLLFNTLPVSASAIVRPFAAIFFQLFLRVKKIDGTRCTLGFFQSGRRFV